jgi:hypothetical protein
MNHLKITKSAASGINFLQNLAEICFNEALSNFFVKIIDNLINYDKLRIIMSFFAKIFTETLSLFSRKRPEANDEFFTLINNGRGTPFSITRCHAYEGDKFIGGYEVETEASARDNDSSFDIKITDNTVEKFRDVLTSVDGEKTKQQKIEHLCLCVKIGGCSAYYGNYDLAISAFSHAIACAESIGIGDVFAQTMTTECYLNIAKAYLGLKDFNNVDLFLRSAKTSVEVQTASQTPKEQQLLDVQHLEAAVKAIKKRAKLEK